MKLRALVWFVIVGMFFSFTMQPLSVKLMGVPKASAKETVTLEKANQLLGQSSCFIENKGQWDSSILFMGDTSFGRIAFTQDAVYYELQPNDNQSTSSHVIELAFEEPKQATIKGLQPLSHDTNFFIGNDSTKWATQCKSYRSVTYENIWEGIDMAYFFTPQGLKYEYYVEPQADIADLQVKLSGAYLSTSDSSRYLEMVTPLGSLKDDQLKVFTKTSQKPLEASFQIQNNLLSFSLPEAPRTETIVIDPLLYSTLLGSTGLDYGKALVTDPAGNSFVVGTTATNDFPMNSTIGGTPAPGFDKDFNGASQNIFVIKLNPQGTELLYATYLGGTNYNDGTSIAIDNLGCAYIVGYTTPDFPMTQTIGGSAIPGYDQTSGGGFIVKLNPSGTELQYATFLGGTQPMDVEVDPLGFTYVAGTIGNDNLPKTVTVGGAAAPGYDHTHNGSDDAFALKLNPQGTEIVYSTYLGGTDKEQAMAISFDSVGNAYVAGSTSSPDFPSTTTVGGSTAPGYDHSLNGSTNCYVVKLNPQGTELLYSSYFGGTSSETLMSMDIDLAGNIYAGGRTYSNYFPMTTTVGGSPAPGYDKEYSGNHGANGFIFKLNNLGTELLYSSYFGGNQSYIKSVKVDPSGNAWIQGTSSKFAPAPMTATLSGGVIPGYDQVQEADQGVFLSQFNPQGTELRYSSFFSGSFFNDSWYGKLIGLDNSGNVNFCVIAYAGDFPTTDEVEGTQIPSYNHEFKGALDVVVAKIGNPYPGFTVTASVTSGMGTVSPASQVVQPGDNATITITPAVGYRIASITDNGVNKTIVAPYVINNVTENHIVEVAFVVGSDKPELKIWAEANKPTFFKNETAMFMVTIANLGSGEATATRVIMTLPPELSFIRATRYRAIEQTSRMIAFEVGTIPGNSVQTFQVDASVDADVTHARSMLVLFDITCAEKSSDSTFVVITLEPKKAGDGSTSLYIGLYYKNVQWDPITSTVFISLNTPLEIDFILTGAKLPYDLTLDWGDGVIDRLTNQAEARQTLKHAFTSKGKVTMKFTVVDEFKKTKTASATIEVR